MAALKASTKSVYNPRWYNFQIWCTERSISPSTAPVPRVLEFLDELARVKHFASNTVKGYLTVISRRHAKVKQEHETLRLSELDTVKQWLRGLTLTFPTPRLVVPAWSLTKVLSVLMKPPYYGEQLHKIGLKYLTQRTVFLVALTTARRASEIHAFTSQVQFTPERATLQINPEFLPKVNTKWHTDQPVNIASSYQEADAGLQKLCVWSSLKAYLKATKRQRAATRADQLFVAYGNKTLGQPVTVKRVSAWLRELIQDCYERLDLPPPACSGHQVRKMATSWADLAGVDPELIKQAATWSSNNMFARHYKLDVIRSESTEFSRRVMSMSAPSSAPAPTCRLVRVQPTTGPSRRKAGKRKH
jgi:hypothetical protein